MSYLRMKRLYKSDADFLIILSWLVYTVSYLGKVNYSANITEVIEFYNVTKAEAGIAPTFFFFAYGIGQVFNGIFCKKYNMKWMIFGSLIISTIINFIVAVISDFSIVKWLWMVNGFVLSILWPTLVRLFSESLPQKDLGRASVIMGTTVASGTLITYGLSSVYALFDNFKLAFYTAALTEFIVAVLWVVLYKKIVKAAKNERMKETCEKENGPDIIEKVQQTKSEKNLFYISICVLCFCAIGVNLIKDGVTTWFPAILKDEYHINDSISILITIFLPIVAVFGNVFALKVHKKISDFVMHCGVTFVVMLGSIGVIIGSLTQKQMLIMIIGFVVVNFLASSLNSLITSIFPIFMRDKVNSGLCAGVLNGFCYVGSTISSYGLGVIADSFGWKMTFWFLMGCCIAVCIVCSGYILVKRITHINAQKQ